MTKPWYQSRMIIVNIIAAVLTAVAVIAQEINGEPVIDPATQGIIATLVLAGLNLILRRLTGQPIA